MTLAELETPKSSAPGQYLGYALQPVRLCFHLLSVDVEHQVSLEHIEDVAVHETDNKFLLEQTKSALTGNPASNRSVDLWKTLANWADLCVANTVEAANTRFRYYVTPVNEGELVSSFHNATSVEEAQSILSKISTKTFIGKKGTGIEPLVNRFLAAGDDICLQIIQNFDFLTEDDPLDSIRSKLNAFFTDETLDQFCAAAIGMAKDEVEKLIRAKKSPVLDAGPFRKNFLAFVRKYDFSSLLIPSIEEPSPEEVNVVVRKLPIFVRQLNEVEASDDLVMTAVSDFLRTTADKIHWADNGDIVDNSLDELDTSLIRHHAHESEELEDTHSHMQPPARGRVLYRKCRRLQLPLEGRDLPSYFIAGEYNFLADDVKLGWHPDYKKIFSSD
ncbi:ABC-three component system protein [Roseibium album]|uniref:ABC-three component system protein n=1 Tax=Roseibium album TaxID=311410 RepID=UPI003296A57D